MFAIATQKRGISRASAKAIFFSPSILNQLQNMEFGSSGPSGVYGAAVKQGKKAGKNTFSATRPEGDTISRDYRYRQRRP
jgi:hypothetical protein